MSELCEILSNLMLLTGVVFSITFPSVAEGVGGFTRASILVFCLLIVGSFLKIVA